MSSVEPQAFVVGRVYQQIDDTRQEPSQLENSSYRKSPRKIKSLRSHGGGDRSATFQTRLVQTQAVGTSLFRNVNQRIRLRCLLTESLNLLRIDNIIVLVKLILAH